LDLTIKSVGKLQSGGPTGGRFYLREEPMKHCILGVGGEWGGSVLLSMEWARTNSHRGFVNRLSNCQPAPLPPACCPRKREYTLISSTQRALPNLPDRLRASRSLRTKRRSSYSAKLPAICGIMIRDASVVSVRSSPDVVRLLRASRQ
jgi:hypothetical protein